jgi:acyl carrier protein
MDISTGTTTTTAVPTTEQFIGILRDLVGFPVGPEELDTAFDQLPGWDSVYLLKLVTSMERETGLRLPVARVLEARSLGEVLALVVVP